MSRKCVRALVEPADALPDRIANDGSRDEVHELADAPGRRQRLERRARQRRLLPHVLQIDDGSFARDGDRFRELANLQIRIDGRRESRRQLEPLPLDRVEACQTETDRVGAAWQIDDLVFALLVAHDGPDLFDERGTGCLDRDARQHRARAISDDTRNGARALRVRRRRYEQGTRAHCDDLPRQAATRQRHATHTVLCCAL